MAFFYVCIRSFMKSHSQQRLVIHGNWISKQSSIQMRKTLSEFYIANGETIKFGATHLFPKPLDQLLELERVLAATQIPDVVLINGNDLDSIQEFANGLNLNLNDQVFVYKQSRLWEIYKIKNTFKEAIVLSYGSYNDTNVSVTMKSIWHRRQNLRGTKFKVVTEFSPPYTTKLSKESGSWQMDGMFSQVFHTLQNKLNFTYELENSIDGQWGVVKPDGVTWTGMVGMLMRKDVDIAATDFTITKERSEVIDFAEPIVQIYHSFFIKNPQGDISGMLNSIN